MEVVSANTCPLTVPYISKQHISTPAVPPGLCLPDEPNLAKCAPPPALPPTGPPSLKRKSEGPPMLRRPPPLMRQNASRFQWPPDRDENWTYLSMDPETIAQQCERVQGLLITPEEVCHFFHAHKEDDDAPAYREYAERWQEELRQAAGTVIAGR